VPGTGLLVESLSLRPDADERLTAALADMKIVVVIMA
jgi:hypothetical protein